MTFISFKIKFNCFEFRSYCFISSTFHLFIDSYYFYVNMPRKTTLNKHLTSKLQVSPNFTLDSVADSNHRGKCDVGGFLIFEWTLQQKCIILADGFIVLELSSKYANSSFSEKELMLFFSFQFINV
jgi:hypothetical protein